MSLILLIEDDATLSEVLKDNLELNHYRVEVSSDGMSGLRRAKSVQPNLLLLDIMLPGLNGFEICKRIQADNLEFPIIMITAKGQECDVIRGLNSGADDYVTKPFSIEILLARIAAFLRRQDHLEKDTITFGECRFDRSAKMLSRNNEEISLTPKEYGVLEFFVRNPCRAVTRDQILDAVWGKDLFVTQRSVDRSVNSLRLKIEFDARAPQFIRTIREVGYRFEISS